MDLDIAIEAAWPPDSATASPDFWEYLAQRAADAVCQIAPELGHPRLSVSILFTDDQEVRTLNHAWREKDRPTNVLSFPMLERASLLTLPPHGPPELLGDIALALETCRHEATEKSVSLADHAAHLLIHGFLHLAGYDHELSHADALAMEGMEIRAMALIGLDNPYQDQP